MINIYWIKLAQTSSRASQTKGSFYRWGCGDPGRGRPLCGAWEAWTYWTLVSTVWEPWWHLMLSWHPDQLSQNSWVGPGGGVKALQVIQVVWLAGPGLRGRWRKSLYVETRPERVLSVPLPTPTEEGYLWWVEWMERALGISKHAHLVSPGPAEKPALRLDDPGQAKGQQGIPRWSRVERKGQTQSPTILRDKTGPQPSTPAFSRRLCLLVISKRAKTSMDPKISQGSNFVYHFLTPRAHFRETGMMQARLPSGDTGPPTWGLRSGFLPQTAQHCIGFCKR